MAKNFLDDLRRNALQDPVFREQYYSAEARIRRAVGEALIRLRKRAQLTQAALGERTGWQQPYIARIERGDAQIITALEGLEAFLNAVDATAVVSFVDRQSGQLLEQVPLGNAQVADVTSTAALPEREAAVAAAFAGANLSDAMALIRLAIDAVERLSSTPPIEDEVDLEPAGKRR